MKTISRQEYRELQAIEMQKYPMHLMDEEQINFTMNQINKEVKQKLNLK